MVLAIMVIITGKPAVIMRTNTMRLYFILIALALLAFAAINLFSSFTPVADANLKIERAMLAKNADWPTLLIEQEKNIAVKPADPFAWTRYSYLLEKSKGDNSRAFTALRMADSISPNEPRQMLERAVMWQRFSDLQNAADRAEQTRLWQMAFHFQPRETVIYARNSRDFNSINDAILSNNATALKWKQLLNK